MMSLSHLRGLGSAGAFIPAAALDLDFLSGPLDPRMIYARTSLASRIDAAGRLAISPHNLCLFSEQFDVGWTRESISDFSTLSAPNSTVAPDGSITADVIDDGAAAGRHIIYQSRAIPGDGCYVASIYVKDSGRRFVQLLINSQGYTSGGFVIADLQTGTLTQTKAFASAAPVVSSAIEAIGNGWFRISISFRVLAGVTFLFFVVATSDRASDASGVMLHGSPSYVGSGMKLAVWGAQLEFLGEERGVRAYVRSNAVPYYGPRLDHDPSTGARSGLLVEDARTNLILRSQAPSSQQITVAAQPYTISFYGSGSIAVSGAATVIVSGAGAYPARRTFTFTPAAGALSLAVSGDVSFAQCEAGTYATSWIPTWSAAGSRAADDLRLDGASIPNWLSASAGSFFIEASRLSPGARGDVLHLRNSANAALGDLNVLAGAGGTLDVAMKTASGAFNASSQNAFASRRFVRAAVAYSAGEAAVCVNGSSATTGSGVLALSQADAMTIGSNFGPTRHFLNGHVRRIRHYQNRLSNASLQRMTA